MNIKHSRLYQELQEKIERDNWIRVHKVAGYSAIVGIVLGLIISLIK